MRVLKLALIATALAGYSLAAHAESGDDGTLAMERQAQLDRGEDPVTLTVRPVMRNAVRVAPRAYLAWDRVPSARARAYAAKGAASSAWDNEAFEGSKADDRQNAIHHGRNPATADR